MKMLVAALKCELKPGPATERITRACSMITILCFVALMVVTFTAP